MAPPTNTSKDLLDMETKISTISSLESKLLVCPNKGSQSQTLSTSTPCEKLVTAPVPKSQVLGKLKDFLGVMAEANKKLELEVKEHPNKDYNIEALTGEEEEYIEMDLALGVADLHTPEAVAAAEAAMVGSQQVINLDNCSSGSDAESDEDDDDDDSEADDDDDDNKEDDDNEDSDTDDDDRDGGKESLENRMKERKSRNNASLNNGQPKKRSKIIEL